MKPTACIAVATVLGLSPPSSGQCPVPGDAADYVYDDGTSNGAFGLIGDGDFCELHLFNALSGVDAITRIDVAYGSAVWPGTGPPAGTPATLCLWEDPNDSRDPLDAQLLLTSAVVVLNPNTDILNPYPIPPSIVLGSFFAGYYLTQEAGEYPGAFDGKVYSNGRAWLTGSNVPGGFDPTDLSNNSIPPIDVDNIVPGVFLLRALGQAVVGLPFCFGDGTGTACPCGNETAAGAGAGCANSTGEGAVALGLGSNQVSQDDLQIAGRNLPVGQPALLFAADQAVGGGDGAAFGDGLRCAGVNAVRLGVRHACPQGFEIWGPGLGQLGGWAPGDVRRFQVWYRDPAGGPCGSGFNLSNGLEVNFGP